LPLTTLTKMFDLLVLVTEGKVVKKTRSGGLPQLDSIALGIGDPAESTDTLLSPPTSDESMVIGSF